MESMPAPESAVTVGVDTHLDTHVAAVIDQAGRLLATQGFPASTRGYVALVTWAERYGPVECIGVEGTGTYGAGLTRFARAYGLQVVEVNRPDRSTRRRRGKPDLTDAAGQIVEFRDSRIAYSALSYDVQDIVQQLVRGQ
jgi:transposase